MTSKGTAGFGLVIAAALIIFAIFAPGSPERPAPTFTGFSGSGLLAQRIAYGAALGGQTGAADLGSIPTQEEIEALINEYLAQASAEVEANLAALLPQYVAGAQADIQAQISGLAAQFVNRGVTTDQLIAALRGAAPAGTDPAAALSRLLAPHVKSAASAPSGGKAPPPQAPAPAPAPAPPATGSGLFSPGDFSSSLKSDMDSMQSKLDGMDFGSMDMD